MSGRRGVDRGNFTAVEEAQLRRLVYRAIELKGKSGYREAILAIESWQVETAPERLACHAQGGEG